MFLRRFLIGKIHRATVTGAEVDYVGSITIDQDLLDASGILPLEEVEVWDVMNGSRLTTYVLPGPRASGEVTLNGAAARKVHPGDQVIICAFASCDGATAPPAEVRVVIPDAQNRVERVMTYRVDPATGAFLRDDATGR